MKLYNNSTYIVTFSFLCNKVLASFIWICLKTLAALIRWRAFQHFQNLSKLWVLSSEFCNSKFELNFDHPSVLFYHMFWEIFVLSTTINIKKLFLENLILRFLWHANKVTYSKHEIELRTFDSNYLSHFFIFDRTSLIHSKTTKLVLFSSFSAKF